jgi:hypothetical protein
MSAHVTAEDWFLIAAVTTVIHIVAMRWCMPTPKAKRQISFAPLAGCVFLVPTAAVKDYSLSFTLYVYISGLLMFVIMLVPVRKRVAADISEQEQNPWTKVQPDTFAMWWIALSAMGCIAGSIYLWSFLK